MTREYADLKRQNPFWTLRTVIAVILVIIGSCVLRLVSVSSSMPEGYIYTGQITTENIYELTEVMIAVFLIISGTSVFILTAKVQLTVFRFHLTYWVLLLSAFLLLATGVFVNPGGPFISLFHTIIPNIMITSALVLPINNYSRSTLLQRVIRILYVGLCVCLLSAEVLGFHSIFTSPFTRGYLLGL